MTNKIDNTEVLQNIISMRGLKEDLSYPHKLYKYELKELRLEEQRNLLQEKMEEGYNINDLKLFINIEVLYYNHDILLNHHSNPMTIETFASQVFRRSPPQRSDLIYTSQNTYLSSLQAILINKLLDMNFNLNSIECISLHTLYNHHNLILNHPKQVINIQYFLQQIFTKEPDGGYSIIEQCFAPFKQQVTMKEELMHLAIARGARLEELNSEVKRFGPHCSEDFFFDFELAEEFKLCDISEWLDH